MSPYEAFWMLSISEGQGHVKSNLPHDPLHDFSHCNQSIGSSPSWISQCFWHLGVGPLLGQFLKCSRLWDGAQPVFNSAYQQCPVWNSKFLTTAAGLTSNYGYKQIILWRELDQPVKGGILQAANSRSEWVPGLQETLSKLLMLDVKSTVPT